MNGYSGRILKVDLSSKTTVQLPTSGYAERFIGGKGIAAKLYWDEAPRQVSSFDEANPLIFATGPLAGVPIIGGSRWIVCGKSPSATPELFRACNLGGDWGLSLKSAGYDALLIRGISENPIYLFIDNATLQFRDASYLQGKGAIETREMLKRELGRSCSVVAIGPAGENLAVMATLLADSDASGSAGMGAVIGSKNLKAIVVKGDTAKTVVADTHKLNELTTHFHGLGKEPVAKVAGVPLRITGPGTQKAPCRGCAGNCLRRTYEPKDGLRGKFMCQSATFYQPFAQAYYGPGYDVPFQATKLCDNYGLDTMALSVVLGWLMMCAKTGILTDNDTDIPISQIGSFEFIETLVRKISLREGFGDVLAQGVLQAASSFGPEAERILAPHVSKGGQPNVYDARLYVNSALLHATEPAPPTPQLQEITRIVFKWLEFRAHEQHSYVSNEVARRIATRFWGNEAAADFSSTEGKALAAKLIQDRQYAKECLILCSFIWPIMDSEHTDDHVGDSSLEARILSAVTGKASDEAELNRIGERVFNLHRAILVREGHRGFQDDRLPETWYTVPAKRDMANPEMLVPDRGDDAVSRKGAVVDKNDFETMRTEYYQLRHWNKETGLPTLSALGKLGLDDIAQDLKEEGFIAG